MPADGAQEITFWGITIPTVVAGAIAWLTSWYLNQHGTRAIKQLESKLRRQEEAYRLLHSPRVTTATKLWSAFCQFERCVRAAASPANQQPEEAARREKAVFDAWNALKGLRDEAEVLLDQQTFDTFTALHKRCEDAYHAVSVGRSTRDPLRHMQGLAAANDKLEQAQLQRADVVNAMRKMIGQADPDVPETVAFRSPEQGALPPRT